MTWLVAFVLVAAFIVGGFVHGYVTTAAELRDKRPRPQESLPFKERSEQARPAHFAGPARAQGVRRQMRSPVQVHDPAIAGRTHKDIHHFGATRMGDLPAAATELAVACESNRA